MWLGKLLSFNKPEDTSDPIDDMRKLGSNRALFCVERTLRNKYIPLVYIAGPFRSNNHWAIEKNIRTAEEIALQVWQMGGCAVCPHTNFRFFQNMVPDDLVLEGYLNLMRRCDAVVFCPGFRKSEGSIIEMEHARATNMMRFVWESDQELLRDWLSKGIAINQ